MWTVHLRTCSTDHAERMECMCSHALMWKCKGHTACTALAWLVEPSMQHQDMMMHFVAAATGTQTRQGPMSVTAVLGMSKRPAEAANGRARSHCHNTRCLALTASCYYVMEHAPGGGD